MIPDLLTDTLVKVITDVSLRSNGAKIQRIKELIYEKCIVVEKKHVDLLISHISDHVVSKLTPPVITTGVGQTPTPTIVGGGIGTSGKIYPEGTTASEVTQIEREKNAIPSHTPTPVDQTQNPADPPPEGGFPRPK